MKKFLSILLAVVLAFSACSMVSFAEETETTEAVTEVSTETPDEPRDINDSMYAKWMDKNYNGIFADAEFAVVATVFGEDVPVNMYIKGGKIATEASRKIGLFNLKVKMIIDINRMNFKFYSPLIPFFYINIDVASDLEYDFTDIPIVDCSDFIFESASKVQVSGTEYYVEKIRDTIEERDMYCYFKDGELVRIETFDDGSIVSTADISYEVSDKDVELPFYAFIDVTPLLTLFGLM